MAEVRIKDIDEHEIDTILAEDIDFEGHLTFKKPLMIKGKFKGEIKSTSALYIGEKAYVEATTEADVVSAKGRHKGDIRGHSRVELFSTSQVDGDITTPDFVVESGCKFNGNCNMSGDPARKNGAAAPGTETLRANTEVPKGSAEPPRGSAEPPRGSAEPPKGSAEPPKGSAEPSRGTAEPPKGSAEPPRAGNSAAPGAQQRTSPAPEAPRSQEAHRTPGGPQPQQQKPPFAPGVSGGQGGAGGGQK